MQKKVSYCGKKVSYCEKKVRYCENVDNPLKWLLYKYLCFTANLKQFPALLYENPPLIDLSRTITSSSWWSCQHHHTIIHIIIPGAAETETDEVVVMTAGGKYLSRYNGDMMLHRFGAQFKSIDLFIQFHHNTNPPCGLDTFGIFGQMLNNALHIAQALCVQCFPQVLNDIHIVHSAGSAPSPPGSGWGADIIHPFHEFYFVNKFAGDGPANTVARRQRFRQRWTMHHQSLCIIVFACAGDGSCQNIIHHRCHLQSAEYFSYWWSPPISFYFFRHTPPPGLLNWE